MIKKKVNEKKYFVISVLSFTLFLTIWWICTDVLKLVPSIALPSPTTVAKTFFVKLYDPKPDGGTLIQHMSASLKVAMSGYIIGVIIGMPLGICMAWYKKVDLFVRPLFDLIKPIPGVAWVPLTIVFFGIGSLSKAMVIFMSVFVSCVVNAYSGINQTKDVHIWVAQTFGASHLKILFKVAIPSALPMMFVSYIFQESSSMPWLTIEQNTAFGLDIKKIPKQEKNERVAEAMEMVGLTKFKDYYPNQLSASMLQRVVIARAFATRPDLLLMDEPYGQLDMELRFTLEDELVNIWKNMGTTVIFITHNIEEAVYLGQRILVLSNKPTSVKKSIINNLPYSRDIVAPEFVDLRNEVTELIKWW